MRPFVAFLLVVCTSSLSAQITDTVQKIIPGRANSPRAEKEPYVIFISADGFRYDLADKYHATHLQALRAKGVAAVSMTPSFPSVTFPNHYTLATGLYPAHHGLVDNTFYDAKKGRVYRINDRAAVTDISWYGGTPLWVLAEQQQMLTASFFWVGSEAAVDGVRPAYYYEYNDRIPLDTRLQVVKDWLTLPEARRPHLILMIHLYAKDKSTVNAEYEALKKEVGAQETPDYDVYLATDVPDRWHYSSKDDRYDRIGDILLIARAPKVFAERGRRINPGAHGFDNALPEMGATFYAWGPAFRQRTIPAFENVNVYPLIAHILGLTTAQPIDGSLEVLNGTLKK